MCRACREPFDHFKAHLSVTVDAIDAAGRAAGTASSTRCASPPSSRLTDDAVAITFDVPAELRDELRASTPAST